LTKKIFFTTKLYFVVIRPTTMAYPAMLMGFLANFRFGFFCITHSYRPLLCKALLTGAPLQGSWLLACSKWILCLCLQMFFSASDEFGGETLWCI